MYDKLHNIATCLCNALNQTGKGMKFSSILCDLGAYPLHLGGKKTQGAKIVRKERKEKSLYLCSRNLKY